LTLIDILIHLLNFAAPAAAVALLVGASSHFLMKKPGFRHILWRSIAINFIVCLGALVAGLWLFGRDGKMQTYFGMALACGSCQWVLGRGWRG
jgi:hypothetical protein